MILEHSRYSSFGRLQLLGLGGVKGGKRAGRSSTEKLILMILEHSRYSSFGRLQIFGLGDVEGVLMIVQVPRYSG